MTPSDDRVIGCERYIQLAALATAHSLTVGEEVEMERHLLQCQDCRSIRQQYQILATDGFAVLSGLYDHRDVEGDWDNTNLHRKLLTRLAELRGRTTQQSQRPHSPRRGHHGMGRLWSVPVATAATCVFAAIFMVAVQFRGLVETRASLEASAKNVLEGALVANKSLDAQLTAQNARMSKLQAENSTQHRQVKELQSQLHLLREQLQSEGVSRQIGAEERANQEALADDHIRNLILQRDRLSTQLQDALRTTERVEKELSTVRADRRVALLRQAELQTRVNDLAATNQYQEQRLADSEQFLASDRDIRELMGADDPFRSLSLHIAPPFVFVLARRAGTSTCNTSTTRGIIMAG